MLQVIERYGVMPDRAPSLAPIQGALQEMGLYEYLRPDRTVVIAGTNGKGTTTATLTHLLRSAGQRVGMYTSPHLVSITERIQTEGRDITQNEMLDLFEKVRAPMERWKLSHFEVLTLMMAEFFYRSGPPLDWFVIEVGMGGSFDATNAIHHQFCVITTLGMDHEKFLGPGLINVARNKFGIIHPAGPNSLKGCDVVYSPLPPEALEPKRESEVRTQARWHAAPPVQSQRIPADAPGEEPQFFIDSPWGKAQLSLAGKRAALNTATALKTFEVIGFDPTNYLASLKSVHWEGRMSCRSIDDKKVYFSGDHNPQGIESLVELLADYRWNRLFLVVGIGIEKDAEGILGLLRALPKSEIHLTETPFRGKSKSDYGNILSEAKSFHPDPMEALRFCLNQATPGDMTIVTGSLYLVGHILSQLTTVDLV